MIDNDKILQIVAIKGPIIPKDLTKTFNTDTFFVGAALSELVRAGKLGISSVKIGGSPFYFNPSQKEKLQALSKYLNEKDQKAYNLLKEQKVLRDSELTPLLRVSMRSIKDFATPIEAKTSTSSEIFWKWYMLSNDECIGLIKKIFFPENSVKLPTPQTIKTPLEDDSNETKEKTELIKSTELVEPVKSTEPVKQANVQIQIHSTSELSPKLSSELPQEPSPESSPELKPSIKDRIKAVFDDLSGQKKDTIESTESTRKDVAPDYTHTKIQEHTQIASKSGEVIGKDQIVTNKENKLKSSIKPKIEEQTKINQPTLIEEPDCDLYKKTKKYFNKNDIRVNNVELIRKNKEIDCLVEIPTPVGVIEYYCKVKSKKNCNDGDLAAAYVNAQMKNLPALFITTGEVTKKAEEMLRSKFKNMKIIKLR